MHADVSPRLFLYRNQSIESLHVESRMLSDAGRDLCVWGILINFAR